MWVGRDRCARHGLDVADARRCHRVVARVDVGITRRTARIVRRAWSCLCADGQDAVIDDAAQLKWASVGRRRAADRIGDQRHRARRVRVGGDHLPPRITGFGRARFGLERTARVEHRVLTGWSIPSHAVGAVPVHLANRARRIVVGGDRDECRLGNRISSVVVAVVTARRTSCTVLRIERGGHDLRARHDHVIDQHTAAQRWRLREYCEVCSRWIRAARDQRHGAGRVGVDVDAIG